MAGLDHRAGLGMDAAPARDGVSGHQGLSLGHPAHHLAASQDDGLAHVGLDAHDRAPVQRPVSAASMQSWVVPNQASIPMIAGR